jgi:actin-related protein
MASNVVGGDEVNALVLDIGSCLCKGGYAGDDVRFATRAGAPTKAHHSAMRDGDELTVDGFPSAWP